MMEAQPTRANSLDGEFATASRPQEETASPRQTHSLGHVYLRLPALSGKKRRLTWLARLLGLEQYSDRLCTQKVHKELSLLAMLLLAVFIFEFAAWGFFFNGLFVGDISRFQSGRTAAALVLALIFAGVILYFERQVVTADSWRLKRWKKFFAQFVRIISILAAGFIVAHVVDLLAFGVPVERMLYAKAVHQEALRLAQDIEEMDHNTGEARRTALADDLASVRSSIAEARRQREQAASEKERYRLQVESLQDEVRRSREAVTGAENRLVRVGTIADDAVLRAAQRELDVARSRQAQASFNLRSAMGDQGAASALAREQDRLIENLLMEESTIRDAQSSLYDHAEILDRAVRTLKSRLRNWITALEGAAPGDYTEKWNSLETVPVDERRLWPEHWRQPLVFQEPEPDFFEKIATVYELAFDRSNVADERAARLPPYLASVMRPEPKLSWVVYCISYFGIHLTAMFVPFLVFAVKWFLMPKEIDAYFSVWHQAFAGDSEARMMLSVEQKVLQRGEHW